MPSVHINLDLFRSPSFITLDHGKIESCNVAAEKMLGWKREDIAGKRILQLFPKEFHRDLPTAPRKVRCVTFVGSCAGVLTRRNNRNSRRL